jgi:hypothetical protein
MLKKCPYCQARVPFGTGCCPNCLRAQPNATTDTMTLDIHGRPITKTEIRLRVGAAVTLLALGVFSVYTLNAAGPSSVLSDGSREAWFFVLAFFSFLLAPFLPACSEHTYLDFGERKIITAKNYAWRKTITNCRPLTDFGHIMVRHLCHPAYGEGPDTFTGSVGLKPLDGGSVLWVKNFDTNEDKVPPAAEEFARQLQKLTGLPLSGLRVGESGFANLAPQAPPSGKHQASSGSRVRG